MLIYLYNGIKTIVSTTTTTLNGPSNTYDNNIANTNKFDNGISFHNPSPDKSYNLKFLIPLQMIQYLNLK